MKQEQIPHAVILLNPHTRLGGRPPIDQILNAFRHSAWSAELWTSDSPAWTEAAARRAVDQCASAVFCAGGDGTLAAALPGLLGTSVPLGVVPLGTGNVWARELGLPRDPGRAIAAQLANPPRPIDVGCVNGRPFLSIASAGFDAEIVRQVESTSKALGQLAYPIAALQMASALHATPARVWIDSEPVLQMPLLAGIVMNAHLYAGILPLGSRSRLDDGRLELVLFTGGPLELARQVASLLAGHQREDAQAFVRHATRVRIEAISTPMPVQADGEALGTTPFQVEVMPRSLLVLLDDRQ